MGETDHDPAKARFLTIQAVRLSGVVTAVLGALVLGGIALVLLGMAISAITSDADTYSPNWVLSRGTLLAGLVMVWVAAVLAVMTAVEYVKGLTASDDDPHQ